MADRLPRKTKLLYGAGDIGFSLTTTIIGAFFAILLTDFGLGLFLTTWVSIVIFQDSLAYFIKHVVEREAEMATVFVTGILVLPLPASVSFLSTPCCPGYNPVLY